MTNQLPLKGKHIYDNSGKTYRKEKKEVQRKHWKIRPNKDRKDLYSTKVMTTSSCPNMDQRETLENNGNEDDKFINGFMASLKNQVIRGLLADTFSQNVDRKLEPLHTKILNIEEENLMSGCV